MSSSKATPSPRGRSASAFSPQPSGARGAAATASQRDAAPKSVGEVAISKIMAVCEHELKEVRCEAEGRARSERVAKFFSDAVVMKANRRVKYAETEEKLAKTRVKEIRAERDAARVSDARAKAELELVSPDAEARARALEALSLSELEALAPRLRDALTAANERIDRRRRADAEAARLCRKCSERPKDTVLAPCGHLCVCGPCAAQLLPSGSCPHCRADVTNVHCVIYV